MFQQVNSRSSVPKDVLDYNAPGMERSSPWQSGAAVGQQGAELAGYHRDPVSERNRCYVN
jgi:hypothetical protein